MKELNKLLMSISIIEANMKKLADMVVAQDLMSFGDDPEMWEPAKVREDHFNKLVGFAKSILKDRAKCIEHPFYNSPLSIKKDGNQWCVLYGDNLQEGVCGFGETPELAILEFNKACESILNEE